MAAVVVGVVHERDAGACGERREVGWGEETVVVLEREAGAGVVAQPVHAALEAVERRRRAAGRAAAVEAEHVRADEPRDARLVLHLVERRANDVLTLRVEHDELVGVEAEPHVAQPRQLAGRGEGARDDVALVEILEGVAAHGVRGEGDDLAVDPERADAELVAALDRVGEGDRVGARDRAQVVAPGRGRERRHVAMGRLPEADRRVEELAAEAPADGGRHV